LAETRSVSVCAATHEGGGGLMTRTVDEGPPLSVIYPRATQHLAKVRVFAEFAGDLMRNYEARMRRKGERVAG